MNLPPITTNSHDVGKIGYAFNHAIDNFGMYQLVVLAGCILLDFVIVVIILIVTTTDEQEQPKSVLNKKRGRTLT